MLWMAPTAQFTAPVPVQPHSWMSADDVPLYLLNGSAGGIWMVPIRVTVAPDGNIRSCEAEPLSKIPALDAHTCKIIVSRGRFQPARVGGVPRFGVYRTTIKYFVVDGPPDDQLSKNSYPDIDVTVKTLPAKVKSPSLVRVMFAVDADGTKSSCTADESEGMEKVDNNPMLLPIACDQIMSGYRAIPAVESGKPVASVQTALVRFSVSRSK